MAVKLVVRGTRERTRSRKRRRGAVGRAFCCPPGSSPVASGELKGNKSQPHTPKKTEEAAGGTLFSRSASGANPADQAGKDRDSGKVQGSQGQTEPKRIMFPGRSQCQDRDQAEKA